MYGLAAHGSLPGLAVLGLLGHGCGLPRPTLALLGLAAGDFGGEFMQGDAADWGAAGAADASANWEDNNWSNQQGGTEDWGGAGAAAAAAGGDASWQDAGLNVPVEGWDK